MSRVRPGGEHEFVCTEPLAGVIQGLAWIVVANPADGLRAESAHDGECFLEPLRGGHPGRLDVGCPPLQEAAEWRAHDEDLRRSTIGKAARTRAEHVLTRRIGRDEGDAP